jgi:hypothetical protein
MLLVGVVEVIAGLLVAVKPRIGVRDFGLMLGALALGRLSEEHSA